MYRVGSCAVALHSSGTLLWHTSVRFRSKVKGSQHIRKAEDEKNQGATKAQRSSFSKICTLQLGT